MQQHKAILAKIAVEKAEEALKTACASLEVSLTTCQNRAYYSVFYIVSALAYTDDFIPLIKSHHKLMGQFNKYYIHENKIFDKTLVKLYKELILNREKSDYDLSFQITKEQVLVDIESAKTFINFVKPYIMKKLLEEKETQNEQ